MCGHIWCARRAIRLTWDCVVLGVGLWLLLLWSDIGSVIVTKVYILGREQGESDLKQHLERSFSKWWYRSSQSGPQICLLQVRKCLLLDLFTHFQWKQIFHLTQFWTMSICILWKLPGLILYLGSQRSLSSKIFITYFKVIFSTQVSYVHCRKIRK